MKIKALAGRLDLPEWALLPEFLKYLASRNYEALDDHEHRWLHVIPGRELTYALNLFIRDQKRYYEATRAGSSFTIHLAETDNITEFNYAYFRHDTGAFVFTHYRGCATGIHEFGRLLKRRFEDYKNDEKQKTGQRKMTGRARFTQIMSPDTWERHLERMQRIDEFTIRVVGESDAVFRERDLRSKTEIFKFQRVSGKSRIIEGIKRKYRELKPHRAAVRGIGEEAQGMTVELGENTEVFDRFEHDEVVEEIALDNFQNSKLMRLILAFKDEPVLTIR